MFSKSDPLFVLSALGIVMLLTCACQGEPEKVDGDGELPPDTDRVVWKTEIGITGLFKGVESAIAGDKLYIVSLGEGIAEWDRFIEDPPKDAQEGVYCLNVETGDIIWHTDIGEDPFSDIAIYEDRLYLYSPQALLCINAADGEKLWLYPLSQWVNSESLAVSPDAVFVGHQDKVLSVDRGSQELLWEATVPIRVRSIYRYGDWLFVGAEGKWEEVPAYLFCFDQATGEELWRYEASDYHELDDPPIIVDGKLYLHSSEGRVHCLDPESGDRIWIQDFAEWDEEDQCKYVNPMVGTPCIVGGRLYIGRSMNPGYVYCVDTASGDIVWKAKRYPDEPDARVTTEIAYCDGLLYFGWEGWTVQTEGGHRPYSSFSCISAEDGSPVWDFELDDRPATTPKVVGDKVYFGSANGYFYCLDAK